jgi:acyl carrier protein
LDKETRIRDFIVTGLNWRGNPADLTSDYPLIERGVLDSLGIFETISFLEESFAIQIGDDDLTPKNFASIGSISQLVERNSA